MSVEQTITSYDRIASEYSRRWQDRSVMAKAIKRFTALLKPGAKVLDIGCGPGFDCVALRNNGLHVIGMDLSWGMLCEARQDGGGIYVRADMRRLPLRAAVAGIWCNAALLHLARADARRALREFHRVLQDGGILYVALKEGHGEQQRSDAYGHERPRYFTYWQEEELDAVLRDCRFRIVEGWVDEAPKQRWVCRLAKKDTL